MPQIFQPFPYWCTFTSDPLIFINCADISILVHLSVFVDALTFTSRFPKLIFLSQTICAFKSFSRWCHIFSNENVVAFRLAKVDKTGDVCCWQRYREKTSGREIFLYLCQPHVLSFSFTSANLIAIYFVFSWCLQKRSIVSFIGHLNLLLGGQLIHCLCPFFFLMACLLKSICKVSFYIIDSNFFLLSTLHMIFLL